MFSHIWNALFSECPHCHDSNRVWVDREGSVYQRPCPYFHWNILPPTLGLALVAVVLFYILFGSL